MIVRGIVEDTFKNQAKVRIPIFDKVFSASLGVDYNDLSEATMCVPPKFDMNINNITLFYKIAEQDIFGSSSLVSRNDKIESGEAIYGFL